MPVLSRDSRVLLTGATGLIGGEVLRVLLNFGVRHIWALVRPAQGEAFEERIAVRMRRSQVELNGAAQFVDAVCGDVRAKNLGLSPQVSRRLRESVDLVVHCAAQTSFIRDAECRETNIAGMRNLTHFVRTCQTKPLVVHVSTAASSGARAKGVFVEEDSHESVVDHYNEYTRSKAAAEQLLVESGLESLVVRPSVVLSAGLRDRAFARAILWFVPLLRSFEALPIDPSSRLDIVPVRFVAESIVRLLAIPDRKWNCYHISAGHEGAIRCDQLSHFIDGRCCRRFPLLLVPPREWDRNLHVRYVRTLRQRKIFSSLRYYLPFLNMDVVYDNGRLRQELGADVVQVPPVTAYAGDLLHLITLQDAEAESRRP